eukprot:CAMPEP_0174912898 /NCGR_PEP_ID=MMETSP0167-20121228/80031_1 /TAXON_ID=38298 /ORGANISM="Rhodella maculata, Strain CCMP736" /LENGTH=121 /DNA_ID=CAMNT_0016157577 /DNA_START=813 /DNA_END=1175 /DNA_ORIENTATION=-
MLWHSSSRCAFIKNFIKWPIPTSTTKITLPFLFLGGVVVFFPVPVREGARLLEEIPGQASVPVVDAPENPRPQNVSDDRHDGPGNPLLDQDGPRERHDGRTREPHGRTLRGLRALRGRRAV